MKLLTFLSILVSTAAFGLGALLFALSIGGPIIELFAVATAILFFLGIARDYAPRPMGWQPRTRAIPQPTVTARGHSSHPLAA